MTVGRPDRARKLSPEELDAFFQQSPASRPAHDAPQAPIDPSRGEVSGAASDPSVIAAFHQAFRQAHQHEAPQYYPPRERRRPPALQPNVHPRPLSTKAQAAQGATAQQIAAPAKRHRLRTLPASTYEAVWGKRGGLYRSIAGMAILGTAIGGGMWGVKENTGSSVVSLVMEKTGLAETNTLTFNAPLDQACNTTAAVETNIKQSAEYVVNYKGAIVSQAEVEKFKADAAYKPIRADSFDNMPWAIKAQSGTKPDAVEPFTKTSSNDRLPQTVFEGPIALGICNTADMSEVITDNKHGVVTIDGSKLAFVYNPTTEQNKKAAVLYEKFAPKVEDSGDVNKIIADDEYKRIRQMIVPDEAKLNLNNPKIDALITKTALNGLYTSCKDIQEMGKKFVEASLQNQYPDQKFAFSWKSGAIGSAEATYSLDNASETDVRLVKPTAVTCSDTVFISPKKGDKK